VWLSGDGRKHNLGIHCHYGFGSGARALGESLLIAKRKDRRI
jgi:predicted protein tyrosine phosphatase